MSKFSCSIVLFSIATLVVIQCSVDHLSGGSGAETGNAKIVGVILDTMGQPAPRVEVLLFPSFYNPVTDTPAGYPLIDTTDIYGKYDFDVPDNGAYTIVAEQSAAHKALINIDVDASGEPVNISTVTMQKTGTIRLNIAPQTGMKQGYVCLLGTSIGTAIEDADISAGYVMLNSIPEGLFSELYFFSSDKHYGAAIAGQIQVKGGDTVMVDICLCALAAEGYDADPPAAGKTLYGSFGGEELKRYAWKGDYVSILTKDSTLDPCVVRRMLTVLDNAFVCNRDYLGQLPPIDKHYQGLLSIAEVPYAIEGLFNGEIGVTGVEMGEDQFTRFYNLVSSQNSFPQELFFVLANNFNFYLSRLTFYVSPKYSIAVSRGFSVFLRFITMEKTGVQAAPIMNLSFEQYRSKIEGLMDLYLADSSLSFSDAFATDTLPFADLKSEHLFASMLMRMGKLYGDSVLEAVWKEINNRPPATNTQIAIDNLVLAFCGAAKENLTYLFTEWRFPVSENAKIEASEKFPK